MVEARFSDELHERVGGIDKSKGVFTSIVCLLWSESVDDAFESVWFHTGNISSESKCINKSCIGALTPFSVIYFNQGQRAM